MTPQQLADALGIPLDRANQWIAPLNAAMAKFVITTPQRQAAFLAQIGHESVLLTHTEEDLNYSAKGLLATFPTHFSAADAVAYAHKPAAIASRAYASRHGNGDEASGDGWKYRGRGLVQITFRGNYIACGQALGIPLEAEPDMLSRPEFAGQSAAWFWRAHGCNELADGGDFKSITIHINGGLNGLDHRQALYKQALPVLTKGVTA